MHSVTGKFGLRVTNGASLVTLIIMNRTIQVKYANPFKLPIIITIPSL